MGPLMTKSLVNGADEHALWTWLKDSCRLPRRFNYGAIRWTPVGPFDIGWNFEKFLVDRNGRPCKRYASEIPAADLREDIVAVLQGGCPRPLDSCVSASGALRL